MANDSQINLQELGATGLNVIAGRVNEEHLRQLQGEGWRRALRDMSNDSVINGMMFAIETLARQVTWSIEPFSDDKEDEKTAEFFRECLFKDMSVTWEDTLSEMVSFLQWGWYFPEICYKKRAGESRDKTKNSQYSDGLIGWRKFAPRAQESLDEWVFDEFGEVLGMVQSPEPDYIRRYIPIEKALHLRTSSHKGNPEGRSILRGAYRDWYFKVNIQNIEAIGIERDLAGLPMIYAPEEYFLDGATPAQKRLLHKLQQTVQSVRRDESEGLVMPMSFDKDKNRRFEFQLLTSGGKRQFDTSQVINRCNHGIAVSILADFLLLGSQAVGSYALSDGKIELFSAGLDAWLDTICSQFNRHAIPRLQKLNGRDARRSPRLVHGLVERISLAELGEFISKCSGAEITFEEEEIEWIKRQAIPAQRKKKTDAKTPAPKAKKTSQEPKEKE